ncbi:hypothetical protein N431DRAFT_495731 [Stipitochalara longipes BDJ]|nr:hypothetical protein N431DRAFT_495731 [Stipitochalara longipes BDJ]
MIAQATKYTQVCEPRYWETKSNDRKTSLDAESPEVAGKATDLKSETIERDAIAIFMPILAYEPSILRKRISKNARRLLRNKEIEEEENNRDILLLKAYLGGTGTKPLHCRRTLDQFSYYMLDSTESRDMDQVLLRWGRKRLEKAGNVGDAPVLMVDQLWLWVLHDGTVITSFPNSWEREEKQPHGLMEKLDEEVKPHGLKRKLDEEIKFNKQRPAIESVDHLVHLIMKLSVDFLRRDAPGGIKFQDAFQSSINNIRLALTKKLNTRALTEAQRTENIEKLFELNLETHLLVEIKDIQDELNIVSSILGQQKDVLRRLHKLCPTNESAEVDSSEQSKETLDSSVESSADALEHSGDKRKHKGILHHDDESEEASIHEKKKEKKVHFGIPDKDGKNTEKDMPLLKKRGLVDDNLAIVMSNIRIVEDMQHYAETVHTSISNLLDLKQRQANAWEARFSREGSQQSQRQGNIMLVFTLVTIVFLPLSFMSSFFALGVNIFPRDAQSGNVSWPLHTLALLLFGISTLVFVPLVFIALYVNQITSFTKETFQSFFLPGNKITDEAEDKKVEEEEESDEESFKDDDDESTKVAEIDEEHTEVLSEDTIETYAKIFGVWTFHTKIPIVRKLWKWQVYLNTRDDDSEYLDDEGIDMGYPLQHFLDKIPLEKWVPTGLYRWLFRHKDEHSEYSYTDTSYDDSNSTRDRRRSRRFVVEEVRRRDRIDHRRWFGGRGSEGDEVVVIEEDSDRPRFRGSRVISPQRIIRRRSSGSDEVVIIEEYSDDPRSRVRRGVRPVKRMTRLFGRRRADSDDEVEVVEEDSDMPRSRARRVFGTVDRITRLFGRRSADSDDEVEVVEDDSDGPPPRIRRAARPVEEFARRTSRRRSDSSDEIVAIEEDSDRSQFRARRAVRPVRPVERIARKSGRRNSNSDDEVVVIEEDSDMPRSFASRVLAPVEWMFRRRGRETDEEYSDETRTSRGEFSATSGSDRPASVHRGLGAALPEPLKRLFLRRRRVHDIESLVEDD